MKGLTPSKTARLPLGPHTFNARIEGKIPTDQTLVETVKIGKNQFSQGFPGRTFIW
jgi:hypothetical protein